MAKIQGKDPGGIPGFSPQSNELVDRLALTLGYQALGADHQRSDSNIRIPSPLDECANVGLKHAWVLTR